MKQKLTSYKTYLWTLITVLITVVIILASTYLPGVLWDMTFRSSETSQSIALDLPDVEEIISTSVENESKPSYYPSFAMNELFPDATYYLMPYSESVVDTDAMDSPIYAFSELVENAISHYFSAFCSASTIAQHTTAWNVVAEGYPGIVDIYYSCTVVVQLHNSLWTINAHGSPTALTHLSRTPYSESDSFGTEESKWGVLPDKEALLQEILPNALYAFLISADSFDSRISEEAEIVMKLENYMIVPFEENTAQDQSYTIYFWLENYDMDFEMVVNLQQSDFESDFKSDSFTWVRILSISQTG